MRIVAITEKEFNSLVRRIRELERRYDLAMEELVADRLYTSDEVGRLLGIGPSALSARRLSGKLPHIRVGNTIRYRWKDIKSLFNKS